MKCSALHRMLILVIISVLCLLSSYSSGEALQSFSGSSVNPADSDSRVKAGQSSNLTPSKPSPRTFHLYGDDRDSSENDVLSERNQQNYNYNTLNSLGSSSGGDNKDVLYYEKHPMNSIKAYQPSSTGMDKIPNQVPDPSSYAPSSYLPQGYLSYYPSHQWPQNKYDMEEIDTRQGEIVGAAGGGILAALSGLLGFKGLKATLPFLWAVPFVPLLIPVFVGSLVLILIPVIAALLFVPFPVIVIPSLDGMSGRSANNNSMEDVSLKVVQISEALPKVLEALRDGNQCLEKVACQLGRVSKKLKMDRWMIRVSEKLPQGSKNSFVKKMALGLEEGLKESGDNNQNKVSRRPIRSSLKNGNKVHSEECELFECDLGMVVKRELLRDG